ncbi:MAG: hypothetical protein H6668_18255 [Ardenticatenaceae bacterium]|nr:hypothetical protein [Ardenticatenaceae bacterium]
MPPSLLYCDFNTYTSQSSLQADYAAALAAEVAQAGELARHITAIGQRHTLSFWRRYAIADDPGRVGADFNGRFPQLHPPPRRRDQHGGQSGDGG